MDPTLASVTATSGSDNENGAGVISSATTVTGTVVTTNIFGYPTLHNNTQTIEMKSMDGCTGANHLMAGTDCWSTGDFGSTVFPAQTQKPTINFNFNGYYPIDTIRLVALRKLTQFWMTSNDYILYPNPGYYSHK
jgi:hypothetical protein